jgi:hypothetical protein
MTTLPRTRSQKNRLYLPAVWIGTGIGFVLVLLLTGVQQASVAPSDRAWPVLVGALLVYVPAGYAAALRLAKTRRTTRDRLRLAPPAVHALAAGGLLTVLHALVRFAADAGISPGLQWFATEALLATLIAGTAGLFASRTDPE